jgi:hypothetical protein
VWLRRIGDRLQRRHTWFALSVYGALALVTQYQVFGHFSHGCACLGTDPIGFMWAMEWWPHAILHGLNPFETSLMWAPSHVNMASTTTNPLEALIATPLTWAAGPVVSYNVWMLIAPITGAICAERLCFHLTRAAIPSIVGGWIYGFSAFETGQIEGHLQLVFTFALPLLLLVSLRWWEGTISSPRLIVYGALILGAQMLSGTEMLVTTTIALAVLGVVVLVLVPGARARMISLILRGIGAYALCAAVLSIFVYYALTGPPLGVALAPTYFADFASFIVPTTNMLVGGAHFASTTATFSAGAVETGTYLGIPLVLILVLFATHARRSPLARVTVVTTVLVALWAMGTYLRIKNQQILNFPFFGYHQLPLPWLLFAKLPLLRQLLPVRVGAYVSLGAAVASACCLAGTYGTSGAPGVGAFRGAAVLRWLRVVPWALALLTLVLIFPNISGSNFGTTYAIPSFFTHGNDKRFLHRNEVVLTLPYASTPLWQAEAHMYFRTSGGTFTPPNGSLLYSSPAFFQLVGAQAYLAATFEPSLRQLLAAQHISAVVVQADASAPWAQALKAVGLHARDVDGVLFYRVPSGL